MTILNLMLEFYWILILLAATIKVSYVRLMTSNHEWIEESREKLEMEARANLKETIVMSEADDNWTDLRKTQKKNHF